MTQSVVVVASVLLGVSHAFDLHDCSWFMNDFDDSGLLETDTRYPMDTCFGDFNSTDNATYVRSYKYTCYENEYNNKTWLLRWTYNDTDCDDSEANSHKYVSYNYTSTDNWDWNDREWNCGSRDCGISVRTYFDERHHTDLTHQCVGLVKTTANYTTDMFLWNPNNCSHSDYLSTCNVEGDRVTIKYVSSIQPDADCDAKPYTNYEYYRNIEGGCYDITCGTDVNRSEEAWHYVKEPDTDLLMTECQYISVWDESSAFPLDTCANGFSTSSDVYDELDGFTYSYKFSCNDEETGVYLWYFNGANCKGTEYFGNYYTEDDSEFSCSGSTNCFSTLVTYSDSDLDCAGNMGVFGPHNFDDQVLVNEKCVRGSEFGDDGSWMSVCDEEDDVSTYKTWKWDSEWCNGTFSEYSERRTGCGGNTYYEVLCGDTHTIENAGVHSIMSWSAALIVASVYALLV